MGTAAVTTDNIQCAKRQLRAQIARGRRGIDAGLTALHAERQRLLSWRTYVARYPAAAIGIAFAAGLSVSAGRLGRPLGKWLGGLAFRSALGGLADSLLQGLKTALRETVFPQRGQP